MLTFNDKIENSGQTPQGRLSASEFNQLVNQVNQNETDILGIGNKFVRYANYRVMQNDLTQKNGTIGLADDTGYYYIYIASTQEWRCLGANSIINIRKTGATDSADVYTLYYMDGSTSTFSVDKPTIDYLDTWEVEQLWNNIPFS